MWAARTVSQCGDIINAVTLTLLVYDLTGSGFGVSSVVVAEILPVLLLAPVAGALVDRLPRVRVMVGADLWRAGLVALLACSHQHLGVVLGVAFGLSVGTVFFSPAAGSALPDVVEESDVVAANSGIWTAAVLCQIVLSPAAGLLVVTFGFGWGFALNAVSYLASAALLRRLRLPSSVATALRRRLSRDALEGARVLLADRLLRAMAIAQLLAALSAGATSALLVVYAGQQLRTSGSGYGTLLAAIGLGACLGPLLVLRHVRNPRRPLLVFGPMGLRGVVDLLLAGTSWLPLAAAGLVGYGLATSTGSVTFTSLLQTHTPERMRGRVLATMDLLWQTGRLASLALGALVAQTLGIGSVYLIGGLLLLAASCYGAIAIRTMPVSAS